MLDKTKEIKKFPKGFLWGVSTSAYQIEGGITNDWSVWEKSDKRIEDLKRKGKNPADFISGQACDSFNRYEEDIKLVKDLGCGAFRIGLEWARIEPRLGEYDTEAIKHYRQVLEAIKKENIKVVLTIWHWTNPIWIVEDGGWANKQTIEHFKKFTELVTRELGDLVDYWITLNEPMIHIANGYLSAKFPPNKRCFIKSRMAFKNLVKAHKRAYHIIHKYNPKAKVSITQLTNYIEPARKWCLIELLIAKLAHWFWNDSFLKKIRKELDYIAFDYYFHDRMVWYPPFIKNLNKKTNDMGWEIYPEGIYHVIKYLSKFKKPLIVMENGIPDRNDKQRKKFIFDHLSYVHKAIQEGAPVIGYFYWSLLDNFEWAAGWDPEFGLYAIDRKTFKRTARPSAGYYRGICQNNKI